MIAGTGLIAGGREVVTSLGGKRVDFAAENAVLTGTGPRCYAGYGIKRPLAGGLLTVDVGLTAADIRTDLMLGLDLSSTLTGWAVLHRSGQLLEAGLLRPDGKRDGSWERVCSLSDSLWDLLEQIRPGTILVEWTKGKVGTHRHHGLGAGLAVYGCGVGGQAMIARAWAKAHPGVQIEAVLENDWTRGVPKADRTVAIVATYPAYAARAGEDEGGDIADAIGLAAWWIRESGLLFRECS